MDYALFVIAFLWAFWAMYVLVMGIYRAHLAKRMTPVTLALSLPFVALGYVMDVMANITIASVVFVEPPQEILVTDRLKRHINHGTGNFGNYPLYIGRRGGTYLPFNGRIYGLIVRGAATDDSHLTHAEKYLAYKSGVSL